MSPFQTNAALARTAAPHVLSQLLEQVWAGDAPASQLERLDTESRQIAAQVLWMWTHTRGVPGASRSAGWAAATIPADL